MLDHTLLSVKALAQKARSDTGGRHNYPKGRRSHGAAVTPTTPAAPTESQDAWGEALKFAADSPKHLEAADALHGKVRQSWKDALDSLTEHDPAKMDRAHDESKMHVKNLYNMVVNNRKTVAPFMMRDVPPDIETHFATAMQTTNKIFGLYKDASLLHNEIKMFRSKIKR